MKTIHLVVGAPDCEPNYLFGAYSDKQKAKKRLKVVKESTDTYADQYFIHPMVIDEDVEDYL